MDKFNIQLNADELERLYEALTFESTWREDDDVDTRLERKLRRSAKRHHIFLPIGPDGQV